MKYNIVGSLGAIEALHIAEVIHEGSPKGVSVTDIAKKTNQALTKIGELFSQVHPPVEIYIVLSARLLRILATNYIFREVSPDVFAHNRNSTALDTGKLFEEIEAELVLHSYLFVSCSADSQPIGEIYS